MATDETPETPEAETETEKAPSNKPVRDFIAAYTALMEKGGASPQVTDALSQALLLLLGSGPAIAAYDSLLHVQEANGIMYHNAVANQQKTNILGMAMTAKCVKYMLDGAPDSHEIDEMLHEEAAKA